MVAILYIIVAVFLGWYPTKWVLSGTLKEFSAFGVNAFGVKEKSDKIVEKEYNRISGWNNIWILLPASFGIGVLLMTWALYIISTVLHCLMGYSEPLGYANFITMLLSVLFFAMFRRSTRLRSGNAVNNKAGFRNGNNDSLVVLVSDKQLFCRELVLYAVLLVFVLFTMYYVFFVENDRLYSGFTVFSDYAPHVAMIRSFSRSANYPTQYPHFGNEDVKYHFMFQFLVGNLEFLGLRLDHAYNIISSLSLTGFLIILSQLAMRMSGYFSAAIVSILLFLFRSGTAFFQFLMEHIDAGDLRAALAENDTFLGYTPNENWGLWCYNVYLNQRHLAFGLLIAIIAVIFFIPELRKIRLKSVSTAAAAAVTVKAMSNSSSVSIAVGKKEKGRKKSNLEKPGSGFNEKTGGAFLLWFREMLLCREAWMPTRPWQALFLGIILGLLSFWNGACVVGVLLILLGFAIFSRHKLDYAITASASVFISFMETNYFIKGNGISTAFLWGFISEDKSFPGVVLFLLQISGPVILGSLLLLFIEDSFRRMLITAFLLPTVFAFTISLTPDVTVNHKYIMISCAFLALIWAAIPERIFEFFRKWKKMADRQLVSFIIPGLLCVLFMVCMCATGFYDFCIIMRNNGFKKSVSLDFQSDTTEWLSENLTEKDLLLSPMYALNEVSASGCMLYLGWPYYAWSAGYDTDYRGAKAEKLYTTEDREEYLKILSDESITHVLYEEGMEYNEIKVTNENLAASCLDLLYTSGDGRMRVYAYNANTDT